jgi:Flp pilus assembly protein TadD
MAHPVGTERHSVAPPSAESSREVVHEDFLFHLYRGSELLQENRVLEAKEELEFALTVQPLDAKGQDLLGTVYFRLGLYPRAIQIYEALEPQFPRDTSIKINLALAYLKTGQAEPARRVLRDAVTFQPEHKRAWGYLGLALQKLGEFEQAQAAFERGGHTLMARRVVEKRRQSLVPAMVDPQHGLEAGVREVAEAAFSELDAGDLRFSLAPAQQPRPGDQWHPVEIGEIGDAGSSRLPVVRTAPPPPVADMRSVHESVTVPPPVSIPATAAKVVAPYRPEHAVLTRELPPAPETPAQGPVVALPSPPASARTLPLPLALEPGQRIGIAGSGVLVMKTSDEPSLSGACRLEAVRVVAGAVATRILHRRRDDAELNEVLGGVGSPMVQVIGEAQVLLAPRGGHGISLVGIEEGAAFVLEDRLLAFQSSLAFECGRIVFDYPGERQHPGPEGTAVVQLRGTGAFALELTGTLATVASGADQPLLVRREWIVGWIGRLVAHALSPADSPGGQRGLIGFAGEGTVLLCAE